MAQWVAADSRVCKLNPTNDPMKFALISQRYMAVSNHEVADTINQFTRWIAALKFIREPPSKLVI